MIAADVKKPPGGGLGGAFAERYLMDYTLRAGLKR